MYDHRVAGRRVFQQEKIQTLWKYISVWQKMQINNVISFTPTIRSVNNSVN